MKNINELMMAVLAAVFLACGSGQAAAQGGGRPNIDPAQFQQQMQQRMGEFIREQLTVTNDDEWKIIEGRLTKVTQLIMETRFAGMGAFRGMQPRNRDANGAGGARRFQGFGQPLPEADALQEALDSNAPKDEVKTALDNYRAARKRKQAELTKAQDDLREVLTVRQEAVLVSISILD